MYSGVKEVRKHNSEEFIKDFRRLNSFLVFPAQTKSFVKINKGELWKSAREGKITYYLTDKIYVAKRTSMVIV